MKNKWGKSRRPGTTPYHIGQRGDWVWNVLKVYGDPRKPYARAFCQVVTPATGSWGDLGDEYAANIPGLIDAWVKAHTEAEVIG